MIQTYIDTFAAELNREITEDERDLLTAVLEAKSNEYPGNEIMEWLNGDESGDFFYTENFFWKDIADALEQKLGGNVWLTLTRSEDGIEGFAINSLVETNELTTKIVDTYDLRTLPYSGGDLDQTIKGLTFLADLMRATRTKATRIKAALEQ